MKYTIDECSYSDTHTRVIVTWKPNWLERLFGEKRECLAYRKDGCDYWREYPSGKEANTYLARGLTAVEGQQKAMNRWG